MLQFSTVFWVALLATALKHSAPHCCAETWMECTLYKLPIKLKENKKCKQCYALPCSKTASSNRRCSCIPLCSGECVKHAHGCCSKHILFEFGALPRHIPVYSQILLFMGNCTQLCGSWESVYTGPVQCAAPLRPRAWALGVRQCVLAPNPVTIRQPAFSVG